jgi:gliding motility-associated-like protein
VKDSVFVLVNEIPQISFIPEDPWICAGDSIFLIASVLPVGSTLIWNTGNTAPGHYLSPEQTTYYRVNALNHNCKNTDSVDVRVNYHPQISLGPDQTLCNGEELTLEVKGLADEYFWSNGSSLPTTQITQSGLYYIVATLDSCISTDTIIIVSCSEIWIPNAFTPDGDNLNDFFKPECLNISEFHMVIYDRWGTLVFESNQCNEGWDGKFKGEIAPFGIYSYVIEFREIKEYVLPGMQLRKGFLMLLK